MGVLPNIPVVAQKAKVARRRERALQVCSTQDAFPKDIKVRLDTEWRAWRLAVSEVTARILSEAHSNLSSDRVLLQGIGQVVEAGETVGYDVEAMSQALVDFNSDVANGCDLVEFVEAQELIQDALGTAPTSFPDVATVSAPANRISLEQSDSAIDPRLLSLEANSSLQPLVDQRDGAQPSVVPSDLLPAASEPQECMTASSNTSAHPAYQSPPATTITPVVRNELSQAWSDVTGSRPRQVVDAGVTVGYDPEAMS